MNLLRLQVLELQKFIFSGKQEKFKLNPNNNQQQASLFENDKLAEVVVESIRHVKAHDVKQTVVRVNHPGRKPLPANLRREEIILSPVEDVSGLTPVGEEITEILEYQQGELYVKKYIRPEYIKPDQEGTQAKRVIAPLPNMPIAKSYVGASLLSHLMVSKYIDHLPIYRQLQMFTRQKITIEDNTVNNWFKQGCNLIEPLYHALEKQVLSTKYLSVDETPIKVLDKTKKGTTHQGYYWIYYNTQTRQVLFKYQTGRAAEWPKETLKNYQGYLQTDGYAVYNQFDDVEGITTLNCWAHARRKFIDAQHFDNTKASEVLTQIQLLYAVEKHAAENNYTADEIKQYRQQHAAPVLTALHKILQTQLTNSLPKSPLGMALQYTLARWDKLNVYLLDGNLRIDNNLVENSIRPVAIGRKNYLFAGNHEAAQRSATLYSLFATCKLHGVNPIEWLTYVFENIHHHKINAIEQLLPQNYAALINSK
ncbi:MAG: IS66 family transposase [Ferruginibacter sp.]|nr:IS66 family transposase [Ferruginibacter sp.]